MRIRSLPLDRDLQSTKPAAAAGPLEDCWVDLHAFVRSRLRVRRDDAEDIVQETFLRVMSAHGADSGQVPAALLRGVARNVVRELWRRRRGLSLGELDAGRDEADCVAASDGPARSAERSEERSRVLLSLLRARAEHVDALVSLYWRGHTVRDIAADSGRTIEAIRSTLRRALRASRRSLRGSAQRKTHADDPGNSSLGWTDGDRDRIAPPDVARDRGERA